MAGFSTSTAWTWVHQALGSVSHEDQFVEVVMSGNDTVARNGAVVLRRASDEQYVLVSFSGTRYQVRLVRDGRERLIVDEPFIVDRPGRARVEISGTTVRATFNEVLMSSRSLPELQDFAGTGTGLAIWQDRPWVVDLSEAISGPLEAAPADDPREPEPVMAGFSTSTAWTWVHQALGSVSHEDQFVEVVMSGNDTVARNGAVVLRRASDEQYVLVSFSGTRYQVRLVRDGRERLIVDEPFIVDRPGRARVEISGTTVRATFNEVLMSSRSLPELQDFAGTGTGLAIWQDRPWVVDLSEAISGPLEAAPADDPREPEPERVWLSGASGSGVADGRFGTWRDRPVAIAGTWNDNWESHEHQWSLQPGFEFGAWQEDLDVAVGAIYKDRGESWKAAAEGAYDDRWRRMLTNLKAAWGERPGTLYIRFAHEFNGDWYPWSVTGTEAGDFVRAWKRFRALQQETVPNHMLVFCPNAETSSSLGLDWRDAFPGAAQVDVMAADYYNRSSSATTSGFDSVMNRLDPNGAPLGLERHRQFAAEIGRPFALPEWSSSSEVGDGPLFVTELHRWLATHGGAGSGEVLYEIHFNVGDYGGGQFQFFPHTQQPETAARYAELW
jgi:hypothetical protein